MEKVTITNIHKYHYHNAQNPLKALSWHGYKDKHKYYLTRPASQPASQPANQPSFNTILLHRSSRLLAQEPGTA
jgi:hypothetical protein